MKQVQLVGATAATGNNGPWATAVRIVNSEGPLALYRGLSAVVVGIIPKMAVRFSSFQMFKDWLGASDGASKGVYEPR